MFSWIRQKKWLLLNAALIGILVSMLGIQVVDKDDAINNAVQIGIGDEKVITLGHITYAAGSVDYTFDGVDDNVQFQAAMNALPATGGRLVVVSAVQINFSATVTRAIPNVTIEGTGAGTYFTYNGVAPVFTAGGNNWHFDNLRTDAGGVNMGATTGYLWTNFTVDTQLYSYYAPNTGIGAVFDLTATSLDAPTGRTATFVVAASDASAQSKAQADYVCDGTADDVQIQAAIDALPAGGGSVYLTEGSYDIADPINITINNVEIYGAGAYTVLTRSGGVNEHIFQRTAAPNRFDLSIHDMTLDGGGAASGVNAMAMNFAYMQRVNIYNIHFENWYQLGIYCGTSTKRFNIHDNNFYNFTGSMIEFYGCEHSTINNNIFEIQVSDAAVFLGYYARYNVISNNEFNDVRTGIYVTGQNSYDNVIIGNVIASVHTGAASHAGIYIYGSNVAHNNGYNVITGNWVAQTPNDGNTYGIYLNGAVQGCLVSDNIVDPTRGFGINTTAGYLNTIKDNQGFIAPGETRSVSGSLTAGVASDICFAWHNTESQDILITKVVIYITTGGGTVGSHLDVGIADDAAGTNRGLEFFDDLLLNNTGVDDSWVAGTGGQQTVWVFCQDSASATDGWVVGQILDANASNLVGSYYIEYVGV